MKTHYTAIEILGILLYLTILVGLYAITVALLIKGAWFMGLLQAATSAFLTCPLIAHLIDIKNQYHL